MPFLKTKSRHIALGKKGEKIAARLLRNKGYDIILKNYDSPRGQIDLIARDGRILCFVEVKTRYLAKSQKQIKYLSSPSPWVGRKQAERIQNAANDYIFDLGNPKINYRFDLIEVLIAPFRLKAIYHWKNNFGMSLE